MQIFICVHLNTRLDVLSVSLCVRARALVCVYVCVGVCLFVTHTHARTYTCKHTHTHILIHTHRQTERERERCRLAAVVWCYMVHFVGISASRTQENPTTCGRDVFLCQNTHKCRHRCSWYLSTLLNCDRNVAT